MAWAASPRLPGELARRLTRAFLDLDPQALFGRKRVGQTFRISGFVAPTPEEFRLVEQVARSEGMIR